MRRYNAPGILIVTNTIEKFKTTDKEQLLKETSALVRLSLCMFVCYYARYYVFRFGKVFVLEQPLLIPHC